MLLDFLSTVRWRFERAFQTDLFRFRLFSTFRDTALVRVRMQSESVMPARFSISYLDGPNLISDRWPLPARSWDRD